MTLDQFIAKWDGNPVDVDKAYGNQCWDLAAEYSRSVVGVPGSTFPYGMPLGRNIGAYEAYTVFNQALPQYYTRLANSTDPNNVPRGDIVVWNRTLPGSGDSGHIAICLSATPGAATFVSLDQNWGGAYVHKVTHNWDYVLGWLRPKGTVPAQGGDVPTLTTQSDLDFLYLTDLGRLRGQGEGEDVYLGKDYKAVDIDLWNSKEARARRAGRQAELDNLSAKVNELNNVVTQISADNSANKTQLRDAIDEVGALTADLATAHDKITDLEKSQGQVGLDDFSLGDLLSAAFHKTFKIK